MFALAKELVRSSALPCVLALTACLSPFDSDEPGWVEADVIGPEATNRFQGSGYFDYGHPPPSWGVDVVFNVHSSGAEEFGGESELFIQRRGGGRPGEGRYEIVPDAEMPYEPGFYAIYSRSFDDGTGQPSFVATSGEVRITKSSESRVAGTFHLVSDQGSSLEVTGSFEVVLRDAPDVALSLVGSGGG